MRVVRTVLEQGLAMDDAMQMQEGVGKYNTECTWAYLGG